MLKITTDSLGLGLVLMLTVHANANADRGRRRSHGADPEKLLKSDGTRVANGCGSEATEVASWWRYADSHTYDEGGWSCGLYTNDPDACDGIQRHFTVNFRDACNLHDVGYEGRFYLRIDGELVEQSLVYDKILDEDVDYSDKSRKEVDNRFLTDMQAQCDQQIVFQPGEKPKLAKREWKDALESCKQTGQGPAIGGSWGAITLWGDVRAFANNSFQTLNDRRKNDSLEDN
jgi:hypothetical protein